jgi:hypothetical protein
MPSKTPKPDEYGRIRVRVTDVEPHVDISINAANYGDGTGFELLDEPASARSGDPLPESLSSKSNRGQSADLKKEKANG